MIHEENIYHFNPCSFFCLSTAVQSKKATVVNFNFFRGVMFSTSFAPMIYLVVDQMRKNMGRPTAMAMEPR